MYQELEMWKEHSRKKNMSKIKFNHEQIASISAIAVISLIGILITYVN